MLGMLGSLLGSVSSGLFGMFGQSSANDANMQLDSTKYQRASQDMQKAGLNPAAMYNGGTPGAPPVMQNTMAAPAAALKDAASSATQQLIANKTIDQLTEQIAKTNAEAANIRAGTPGVAARGDTDVMRNEAIRKIPRSIRIPLVQAGFGADTMKSTGNIGAIGGAGLASAKAAKDAAVAPFAGLSGPDLSSARSFARRAKERYDKFPSYSEADREAARLRNAKRWGWLTGAKVRGSVQAKQ